MFFWNLLSLWSNKCWQFDLWFLWLFKTQFVHLEVLGSVLPKPSLKDFENHLTSSRDFLGGSDDRESDCNAGDVRDSGWIPVLGRSLFWKDPLEEEMATHSRILSWRIPWTEKPVRLKSVGSQRIRHDWSSLAHFFLLETERDSNYIEYKQSKHPN